MIRPFALRQTLSVFTEQLLAALGEPGLAAAWIGAGRVWYVCRNLGVVEEFIEGSRTAPGDVCFDLGEDMVKPSRRGILLNLTLPSLPKHVLKALGESVLLACWKLPHRRLDFLYSAHILRILTGCDILQAAIPLNLTKPSGRTLLLVQHLSEAGSETGCDRPLT